MTSLRCPLVRAAALLSLWAMSGCYSLKQSYYQTRLLFSREDLEEVVRRGDESPERLERLRIVPQILAFARSDLGLQTGGSYEKYVRLPDDSKALTWVVQAAERRALVRKTWWFPLIGEQPYLGFFRKQDAEDFQKELKDEKWDTRLAGVDAFSLLGFLSDPLYSSMIDGRTLVELVDVLIHESVHQTLYIPNEPTFNESFADFVAKKGTVLFLERHGEVLVGGPQVLSEYLERAQTEQRVSKLFQQFLERAKASLKEFYDAAARDPALKDDEAFLQVRSQKFDELAAAYAAEVKPLAKGTWYERAFAPGNINNAVILGYALYESNFEPFEKEFARAGGNVAVMVSNMRECLLNAKPKSATGEHAVWGRLSECQKGEEK